MQESLKIIVCPNEEKIKILKELEHDKIIHPIKFMTKKEYLNEALFSYSDDALFYLIKKYNFHIDVAKVYLENLYVIDINKEYKSEKLNFLKELKLDLLKEKLLKLNTNFSSFISGKNIEVRNYYDLDLYEEKLLNYKLKLPQTSFSGDVYEFQTMEEEVNFVCIKIINLLRQGIDINKIYLANISSDYYFTLDKMFSYYNIPIEIDFKDSIYSTKLISDYLKEGTLPLEEYSSSPIIKNLVSIISSLSNLDSGDSVYREILVDKIKKSTIPNIKKTKAVHLKNLYNEHFTEDEYVFVLGFNQEILPRTNKDIDFITDSLKDEVEMYKTDYKNKREKEVLTYILSTIPNLYLSYKLSTPFQSFYKSSLIDELSLNVITDFKDTYEYSNKYNRIRLREKIDQYNLYGEKSADLELLNEHYKDMPVAYSNEYTGISHDLYLENLPYPLRLSYTSLNSYNECSFKYYLKNVLKLDEYKDTFSSFIGSLYHKILSLYNYPNFDFEKEYNNYLQTRELTLKEKLLLVRIKSELQDFLKVIKKQSLLTGYDKAYFEKKVEVPLSKDISVTFIGYIDKILYYQKVEDTYFSIIDYKTGVIDTHIEPMKYGLHMQLPVYLYLIHYGKVFTNPIFTGIYYQNILFPYPTWTPKLEQEKKAKYYLNGYSTDDVERLEKFDSTYESSELIKSMKYTEEKGFGAYTKTISNEQLYDLVKYTKNHIDKTTDKILNEEFQINPKVYAEKNMSCEFCTFQDICYKKEKDLVYLEKQNDLSFLGGDE